MTDAKNRDGLLKSSKNVMKLIKYIENLLIKLTCNFTSHISGLSVKIIISTKNYDYNFNSLQNMTCFIFRKSYIIFICYYVTRSVDYVVNYVWPLCCTSRKD